jgi:uncharacterized protein
MKKTLSLIAIVLFFNVIGKAQTKPEHTIKVIGTAEMEIVPDEIYVSVTLKEYTKDKKKYSIEELEKGLVNYLEKITGTEKKDVKMDNMSAYILSMKRKNKDEIITKSYDVKFKNAQQVYLLYNVMDSLGVSGAYVRKYSHSKMDEYKKEIKIKAITAAKDKAVYLLAAIGEKAGKAVSITERNGYVTVDDGTYENRRDYYSNSNTYSQVNSTVASINLSDNIVGDKTIKLNYIIDAEFEIQ